MIGLIKYVLIFLQFIFLGKLKKNKEIVDIEKAKAEVKSIELDNAEKAIEVYIKAMGLLEKQVASLLPLIDKVAQLEQQVRGNEKIIKELEKRQEICDDENEKLRKRVAELEERAAA